MNEEFALQSHVIFPITKKLINLFSPFLAYTDRSLLHIIWLDNERGGKSGIDNSYDRKKRLP